MNIIYYKTLKSNPYFSLKDVSILIKKGVIEEKISKTRTVYLGGMPYRFSFNPSIMTLTIEWEDEAIYRQDIHIIAESSNLPSQSSSNVYYFVCPGTGLKCRTLYKIGSYFLSRRAFYAIYPQQMKSKRKRIISYREKPYRKNGKEYYRGKLTPYGKRCIRYENRENRLYEELEKYLEISCRGKKENRKYNNFNTTI